jgi:ribosomal peptide maturation radical SAM protein 1
MAEGGVVLVGMPWEPLSLPSLQVGTLTAVLERAGLRVEARSLHLAFMEHCRSVAPSIRLDDYHRIGRHHYSGCLSDWVFAVPPFRDTRALDAEYLDGLRRQGVPERDITQAQVMKSVVSTFLEASVVEILAAAPAVVVFATPQSQFTNKAYSQSLPALVLAKILRAADPSVKIVFAGASCAGAMGAALLHSFPWVDVVVRGEAELILPGLVRDLLAPGPLRPQPGFCYREHGAEVIVPEAGAAVVPMDELPTPNYDEYFERLAKTSFAAALSSEVQIQYEASRGCWWGAKSPCTFCGLNGSSMQPRRKSPTRVVEELAALASRHGRLEFALADTILHQDHLRDALPRLHDLGLDLRIFCEIKANLTRAQVRSLREGGVDHIQPGIESLSDPILKRMGKGTTPLQNVRLLKWCAEYGVAVTWNLLYGLPGEPPEEYARMADVLPSLSHLTPPRLVPLYLDRFSPYFERPAQFGLTITGVADHYAVVYPVEEAALGDLAHWFTYAYADGRDPEQYIGPIRRLVDEWNDGYATGFRSLSYRRGPDFLRISDRRPNLPARDYTLGEREALIYLVCEDGATPAEIGRVLVAEGADDVSEDEIREFLDGLVASRLVYRERDRYLALALPPRPRDP